MIFKRTVVAIATLATLFISSVGFARSVAAAVDGNPLSSVMTEAVSVSIQGMVTAIGVPGAGMTLDTGEQLVTVYGIGPLWFWNSSGVSRPEVGEQVSVSAYEVTLSDGTTRLIASEITVGDNSMVLRDAETGLPLWRGAGMHSGSGATKRCARIKRGCCQ